MTTEPVILSGGPHHGEFATVRAGAAYTKRPWGELTMRYDRTDRTLRTPDGLERRVYAWVPQ